MTRKSNNWISIARCADRDKVTNTPAFGTHSKWRVGHSQTGYPLTGYENSLLQ